MTRRAEQPSKRPADAARIRPARVDERDALLDLWLRAVRATHDFLTEADIAGLLPVVRDQALPALTVSVLTDAADVPIGFVGCDGAKIEALFLDPAHRRQGGGRALVDHARAGHARVEVDVNEQNAAACGFYAALGFTRVGRSPVDGQGRPFPLLHLRWDRPGPAAR